MTAAVPELRKGARKLWQETKELNLIFNAIIHSSKKIILDIRHFPYLDID
jgi:hypothetical protein